MTTDSIDEIGEGSLEMSMGCGDGCSGAIDATSLAAGLQTGRWAISRVPLACFIDAGLDPARVISALGLSTDAATTISLHAVSIKPTEDPLPACPV